MELGMIGLGRMGANMAQRLLRGGHAVVGFDPKAEARAQLERDGGGSADSLQVLVAALPAPRVLWMMVPAGRITDDTMDALAGLLAPGDVVIDGGNSNYKDTLRRAEALAVRQVGYVDCGTSGGVWGLAEGYSLMVGGDKAVVERLRPVFETLAPAADAGWGHVGPVGSGHFTKMVHNGIEYGLMQAYAEGFEIMHASEYPLDLEKIAKAWMHGTVIRSWLLELAGLAFEANGTDLENIKGWVADSGEGRWTVAEAIDHDVPAPIITLSLLARFASRQDESYSAKVTAALRQQFGGHAVKSE